MHTKTVSVKKLETLENLFLTWHTGSLIALVVLSATLEGNIEDGEEAESGSLVKGVPEMRAGIPSR